MLVTAGKRQSEKIHYGYFKRVQETRYAYYMFLKRHSNAIGSTVILQKDNLPPGRTEWLYGLLRRKCSGRFMEMKL